MIEELARIEKSYVSLLNRAALPLFFHHPDYLRILAKHLDAVPFVVCCSEEKYGENFVAMPFMVKKGSKGKVLNSLPYFGSNGSFISQCESEEVELLLKEKTMKELIKWSESQQIVSINIVSNYLNKEDRGFYKKQFEPNFVSERFGQVTLLPEYCDGYEEVLLRQFEDPRPRNIRKARNSDVRIRKSNSDADWTFLFEVHKQNMSSIGAPVKKKAFFDLVKSNVQEANHSLYIAEIDTKPVACMLIFHIFETVEYYTPGTMLEYRNQQPSALLVFHAMQDMASLGYKYWNWGGSSSRDSGVYTFKKKWGAVDMPYYHLTYILDPAIYDSTEEELLEQYPGFFVVPFNALENGKN